MKMTDEQIAIIRSTGNIKINAVAGSGKTTTIIEYAKARPRSSKILYLAFNKSVRLEATRRFADEGLPNVKVETAHSLAYRHIILNGDYNLKNHGYKSNEITEILKLKIKAEKHDEFVIANHIIRFLTFYCNSNKEEMHELNYLETIAEPKAKSFVSKFYKYIYSKASVFFKKMEVGEIEVSHDFYLKKFQLSNPVLPYDYILFDEGQDASGAMLDVFMKQKATKVLVGDTHQQIYGWRYAVNSLENTDFKTFQLSCSFRFSQDIANLAMAVLKFKKHLKEQVLMPISGLGNETELKSKAILARTNLGLLQKAIEFMTENPTIKHIYFEGNFNSYTYADEGASLYDVLHLYNHKRESIRDKLIKSMNDLEELEEFSEKTEDIQLSIMVDIIKKYGNRIPGIIKSIKEKHVENDQRFKAQMIFSTVHRCKGMEYDYIELVNDFMTEERLIKLKETLKPEELNPSKLMEEINLLYVAITRTKHKILIHEKLMPKDYPISPFIRILKPVNEQPKQNGHSFVNDFPTKRKDSKEEKSYSVNNIRTKYKQAYRPWTMEHDEKLTEFYLEGVSMQHLARHFGRTERAIESRINKLGLFEL